MQLKRAKMLPGYYALIDTYDDVIAIVVSINCDDKIIEEITRHLNENVCSVSRIHDNAPHYILDNVYKLIQARIVQGYIIPGGEPIVYKTRVEIIDELLKNL